AYPPEGTVATVFPQKCRRELPHCRDGAITRSRSPKRRRSDKEKAGYTQSISGRRLHKVLFRRETSSVHFNIWQRLVLPSSLIRDEPSPSMRNRKWLRERLSTRAPSLSNSHP